MQCLIIELACQSCSFRNPEFQNFHKTFELPPPTTIIGLAGSALGLSPKGSQDFFDSDFEFGISGYTRGKSNDLWKYQKLKGKGFISDILTREILFDGFFIIAFASENHNKIAQLQKAFKQPVYALTLGNSDALTKVKQTSVITDFINCNELKNCLIEGNVMKEVLDQPNGLEFSIKDGIDPISYEIPVAFEYDSDYGVRKVARRKEFSFLGSDIQIKGLSKRGVIYKEIQIPFFTL